MAILPQELQLEEHYWGHVEHYCMHPIKFQNNIVDEAINQLIHACGGTSLVT